MKVVYMDMDEAAVFLAGSILTALGFLIWVAVIVFVNNLVHKYWKSWGWTFISWHHAEPTRFMTEEEAAKVAPTLKEEQKPDTK